ncbi:flagellar protein FliS [Cerasibacillus quisquiliarum]|uniref:Flagellar secretion chaperone FliS n=1 Tax=Cerasibacillus quisquiliarum TaxID=227865 RepID=A0A511UVY0_9BACI|nr:flagellar export chaperone FliS [Cerasibacillus quisquiliarum]MBB5145202.1 flagellar protein FliS [Cerasibacillus quisquiliarum]GEN29908.1 flagellar protein FliS [Cerasibacillus quisquiliarum]
MMPNNAYQTYQNNAIKTASGGELTLMLYNGCVKFIKRAIKDIEVKDYENKNKNIQKAQRIIQELMITLDPQVDLSKQIMPLYDYMHHRLTKANIENNKAYLEEVLEYVIEFRETWKQVLQKTRQTSPLEGIK